MGEYVGQIAQGIITLVFAVITWRTKKYLDESFEREKKSREEFQKKLKANEVGTQALLRHHLLHTYYICRKRGKISYSEASSFEAICRFANFPCALIRKYDL